MATTNGHQGAGATDRDRIREAEPSLALIERLALEYLKTEDKVKQDALLEAIKFTVGLHD